MGEQSIMQFVRFISSGTRIVGTLLLTALSVAPTLPVSAALQPDRERITQRSGGLQVSKSAEFVCGTYKGNQIESVINLARHQKLMRDVTAGKVRVNRNALDMVTGDVWVVEDDGTLLIGGMNDFDTDFSTFRFTPAGTAFNVSSVAFNYDSNFDGTLATGDDGSVLVGIGFSFPFAGSNWSQMFVSGNGMISFSAAPNPSGFYRSDDFFSTMRQINPFYMDLNPAAGGDVQEKSYADHRVITWVGVPEFGTGTSNTFQLTLWDDGRFDTTFNGIDSPVTASGAPIYFGFNPGAGAFDLISYSNDLPHAGTAGSGIYEDYINIANPIVNETALLNRFINTFGDIFFQITFFTNFQQTMGGFANELNISNDISGIGLGIFDDSATYGSAGVLESRCNMNRLAVWPSDPHARFFGDGNSFLTIMGQESGHRWGAFMNFRDSGGGVSNLILGRSDAHWSFYVDNDHSSLEGGNWEVVTGNNYTCPTQIDHYPSVDEYTFGLRLPEEVKDLYYLDSPTNNLSANRSEGTPTLGDSAVGTPVVVTINDIIAAEGPRTPTRDNEEHDLRHGFILVVQAGNVPTAAELTQVAAFRSAWEDYFELSCDGRLTCNTSLTNEFGVATIIGSVVDAQSGLTVDDFTMTSVERTFVQNVPAGGFYTFRYQASAVADTVESITLITTAAGYFPDSCVVSIAYGDSLTKNVQLQPVPTSVAPGTPLPYALYANVPNPFNPMTTIRYDTKRPGDVALTIYNVTGKQVRRLVNEFKRPGHHQATWNGRDNEGNPVASGMYFYRIDTGEFTATRKMLLMK